MTNTTAIHPTVASVFADIDACPEGHIIVLDEGEPLHQPAEEIKFRRRDQLIRVPNLDEYEPYRFTDWYRADGALVPVSERTEGWFDAFAKEAGWTSDTLHSFDKKPNAALRAGDNLLVSRGSYYRAREVDGGYEFLTVDGVIRERREAADVFIASTPAITESQPAWAHEVRVYLPHDDDPEDIETEVYYERKFEYGELNTFGHYVDGEVVIKERNALSLNFDGQVTPDELRGMALELIDLAEAVENAA